MRSIIYSYKIYGEDDEHKRAKGVKKNVIKHKITHEDYKNCLFSGEDQYRSMNLIQSDKHNIYTVQVNKNTLSSADDKRVILPDKISTLAYGHWRIKHSEDN